MSRKQETKMLFNVVYGMLRHVTWQTWEKRITFVTLRCRWKVSRNCPIKVTRDTCHTSELEEFMQVCYYINITIRN